MSLIFMVYMDGMGYVKLNMHERRSWRFSPAIGRFFGWNAIEVVEVDWSTQDANWAWCVLVISSTSALDEPMNARCVFSKLAGKWTNRIFESVVHMSKVITKNS